MRGRFVGWVYMDAQDVMRYCDSAAAVRWRCFICRYVLAGWLAGRLFEC